MYLVRYHYNSLLLLILITFSDYIITNSMALSVGFVGVGIMGKGMIRNLATKLDNPLVIWNRSTGPAEELLAAFPNKISIASSAAEVINKCDITFTMLSNLEASVSVFDDETNGIIAGVKSGKLIIDCATLSPERMRDEEKRVINKGGIFLEAPVSGSKVPAETGQLIFLCGGSKELFDNQIVQDGFKAMGKAHYYFGEVGQGSKVKLVVNMILGTMMSSFAEGLTLSESLGLPTETLLQVIDQSALACPMYKAKGPNIVKREFPPHFPLKHAQKDLRLALELADDLNLSLPTTKAANEQFIKVLDSHGDEDLSAVFNAYQK